MGKVIRDMAVRVQYYGRAYRSTARHSVRRMTTALGIREGGWVRTEEDPMAMAPSAGL